MEYEIPEIVIEQAEKVLRNLPPHEQGLIAELLVASRRDGYRAGANRIAALLA